MSKHHSHKEKSVKENNVKENNVKENKGIENLGNLMENIDMNQISSLMNQIDLKDMDMDKVSALMNNMGLGNIDAEQLNSLAQNLNLGDLNNLDLSAINSENINSTLANLIEQVGNVGLNNSASKENKEGENDLGNTLNDMMKTMEESDIYKQLTQYYSQQTKK